MPSVIPGELLDADDLNAFCPVGVVLPFAGSATPQRWLLCDGTSYLRADYPDLFAIIGTAYGAADGTHFNVPDMRGRVAVGLGTHVDVAVLADDEGEADVANRRPKHKHTFGISGGNNPTGKVVAEDSSNLKAGGGSGNVGQALQPTVGPQTGAEPTDAPAYLVLNYIIKT